MLKTLCHPDHTGGLDGPRLPMCAWLPTGFTRTHESFVKALSDGSIEKWLTSDAPLTQPIVASTSKAADGISFFVLFFNCLNCRLSANVVISQHNWCTNYC